MPQFYPGETKTAKATMTNPKSAAFDYHAVLYMGVNQVVMAEADFRLNPRESKQVPFSVAMPISPGEYPVYISISSGGKLLARYQATESVTVIPPQPAITSIDIGALTKQQGAGFPVTIEIESAFTGPAWLVFAYGKGQALPGAGFRPVYTSDGRYLGWFPEGFNPDLAGVVLPFIGGIALIIGKNTFTISQPVPALYPLGVYTTYVAVIPPAANWLQWSNPHAWKMGPSFTVVEPPLPVWVSMIIGQDVFSVSGSFKGYYSGLLYGLEGDRYNYLGPVGLTVPYCQTYPGSCLLLPYMQFFQPLKITYLVLDRSSSQKWLWLGVGAYIVSAPPLTVGGRPGKYYQVVLTGRLTYPNGTFIEKSLTLTVPRTDLAGDAIYQDVCYLPFGTEEYGGKLDILPAGQYSFWLKAVVEGIDYGAKIVQFTIE